MTSSSWRARITVEHASPTPEQLDQLRDLTQSPSAQDADVGSIILFWRLEAPTLLQATESALRAARSAVRDILGTGPTLAGVEVAPAPEGRSPQLRADLLSRSAVARRLGLQPERVRQLAVKGSLVPYAKWEGGEVFDVDTVERFAQLERPAHRPPKRPG